MNLPLRETIRRLRHGRRYLADELLDLSSMRDFRAHFFPKSNAPCWLDRPDALQAIDAKLQRKDIDEQEAALCRHWVREGYCIVNGLIDAGTLDRTFGAYEAAIANGRVSAGPESHGEGDPHPGRALDAHVVVPEIAALSTDPRIMQITELLLGRKTRLFQTLIGHKSSQQLPHSDSIHMTTYPLGYMVASWIPFEDIHRDSGPLTYYPGSHRLPYLLSKDIGITSEDFRRHGYYALYVQRYEPALKQAIDDGRYGRKTFCPAKGDVLFWHANLAHGGSTRNDLKHSRKALVSHYFAQGVVTYSEMSGELTPLHDGPVKKLLRGQWRALKRSLPNKT
jgi:hypothetical protein